MSSASAKTSSGVGTMVAPAAWDSSLPLPPAAPPPVALLHPAPVPRPHQLGNTRRRQRPPVLTRFDFLGDSYDHGLPALQAYSQPLVSLSLSGACSSPSLLEKARPP